MYKLVQGKPNTVESVVGELTKAGWKIEGPALPIGQVGDVIQTLTKVAQRRVKK